MKCICVLSAVAFVGILATGNSLQQISELPDRYLDLKVGDPCGAAANLVASSCGHDATTCEDQSEQITIGGDNGVTEIFGISVPIDFPEWTINVLKCKADSEKTSCATRQHSQFVSAPGNRVNDAEPACGGTFVTTACETKDLVKEKKWGLGLLKLFQVTVPNGCQTNPSDMGTSAPCPGQYQTVKSCE